MKGETMLTHTAIKLGHISAGSHHQRRTARWVARRWIIVSAALSCVLLWLMTTGQAAQPQATEVFQDRFQSFIPAEPGSAFDEAQRQHWPGIELEGQIPYCENQSIRWISVVTDFDVNLDGKPDILLPISCYQGPEVEPGSKHNRTIIAAWKMFCSQEDGSHQDCTEALFGTPAIKATGTLPTGGGNPYIHVMDTPRDLNGNGYPDFWYALNRDDGRPGFDFEDPTDRELLKSFCGAKIDGDYNCTRIAIQTVLLSQGDGTYAVKEMPFGQTNTQAVAMMPNVVGTYDFLAFNYGPYKAARLTLDNTFIDVTEEYAGYKNIESAALINPYVHTFEHEGTFYLATSEVISSIYNNPTATDFDALPRNEPALNGITLWVFEPGVGFTLSDFFLPDPADQFTYQQQSGDGSFEAHGAYIRGVPVYQPRWNFFEYTQLHPNEAPVLVAAQESAGTTAGAYFRAPPDPDAVYSEGDWRPGDKRYSLYELSVIEAFYIEDGKLVPREAPVVDGDVLYNSPGFKFTDLNGNGYMDMYTISGHNQRPSIYLNNRQGVLEKRLLQGYIPDTDLESTDYFPQLEFTVRDLGRAPYLDFIYWGKAGVYVRAEDDPSDDPIVPPEFNIIRGVVPIDKLPIETPEQFQQFFTDCIGKTEECYRFFVVWKF